MFNQVLGTAKLRVGTAKAQCCSPAWLPAADGGGNWLGYELCKFLKHLDLLLKCLGLIAKDLRVKKAPKNIKNKKKIQPSSILPIDSLLL